MERSYVKPQESLIFTGEQISKAIDHIKASKSQGLDSIDPKLIKETKSTLKKPLNLLFIKSLEDEKSQQFEKNPNVTAIVKTGERCKAENYCPISLTSVRGKLMKRLVRKVIVENMTTNNLFSDSKHDFFKVKSCIIQLLRGHNKLWTMGMMWMSFTWTTACQV